MSTKPRKASPMRYALGYTVGYVAAGLVLKLLFGWRFSLLAAFFVAVITFAFGLALLVLRRRD